MLLKTLLLVVPLLVAAAPELEPAARDTSGLIDGDLESLGLKARDCDYNGCKCLTNHEGVWCAQCKDGGQYVVRSLGDGGATDHVYQCNKNGNCCDFGYATKCKDGKAGRCGN